MTSDAALVLRARGGDELAFRRLLDRHDDMIGPTVAKYFPPAGLDMSDLRQEGEWGFAKAVKAYRPDRNSGFRNFAEMCVNRQVMTALTTARRGKHSILNEGVSMDAEREPEGHKGDPIRIGDLLPDPKADVVRQLETSETLAALVAAVWRDLSDLERTALCGYIDGVSYEDIAAAIGASTKTIDNALQRCRRKLAPVVEAAA